LFETQFVVQCNRTAGCMIYSSRWLEMLQIAMTCVSFS